MSLKQVDDFLAKLARVNLPLRSAIYELERIEELDILDLSEHFDLTMLELLGLRASLNAQNELVLKSKSTPFKKDSFCVVDIETNGSFKNGGQIIEIGALRVQGGKEVARFHSLVHAPSVPSHITELTGIEASMLEGAPSLGSVLNAFRLFLRDDIFVAHNVSFDYSFISSSLQQCGFGILLNQKLCTIDLSRRLIESQRYSLDALKALLGVENEHHRALSDASSALSILNHCTSKLPFYVKTTQELLNFSKS